MKFVIQLNSIQRMLYNTERDKWVMHVDRATHYNTPEEANDDLIELQEKNAFPVTLEQLKEGEEE